MYRQSCALHAGRTPHNHHHHRNGHTMVQRLGPAPGHNTVHRGRSRVHIDSTSHTRRHCPAELQAGGFAGRRPAHRNYACDQEGSLAPLGGPLGSVACNHQPPFTFCSRRNSSCCCYYSAVADDDDDNEDDGNVMAHGDVMMDLPDLWRRWRRGRRRATACSASSCTAATAEATDGHNRPIVLRTLCCR